jgi:hypothetical protein
LALTVSPSGQLLTALFAPVQKILLGLVVLSDRMIFILGLNAPIRVSVIVLLVYVTVLLVILVSLVNVQNALMNVTSVGHVCQKNILLNKQEESMLLHGMRLKLQVVSVILAIVVLPVSGRNVPQAQTLFRDMAMKLDAIVLVVEYVIIIEGYVNVLQVSLEQSVNIRRQSVEKMRFTFSRKKGLSFKLNRNSKGLPLILSLDNVKKKCIYK